jgi:hypothetical protein
LLPDDSGSLISIVRRGAMQRDSVQGRHRMTAFFIGLWIGGAVGALAVAIFVAAAHADTQEQRSRPGAELGLSHSAPPPA